MGGGLGLSIGLLLDSVVVPALAAVVLFGASALFRPVPTRRRRLEGAALVLAIAALAGFVAVVGWPAFPPRQALGWLPLLLLAAVLVYGVADRLTRHPWPRRLLLAIFPIVAVTVLILPLLRYGLDRASALGAGTVLLGWILLAQIHDRPALEAGGDDLAFGWIAFLVAAANGPMAALSGSVMLGQLSGVVATAIAVWGLWSVVLRHRPLARAGRGVVVMLLAVLLLIGQVYGATPLWATVLLVALLTLPPIVAPLVRLGGRADTPVEHSVVALLLAGVPLAIGLYFIVRSGLRPGEF